jgi:signal transduction histidine kinase
LGYDLTMRNAGSILLIDWFAISLRWVVLMGLSIAFAAGAQFTLAVRLVFLTATIFNFGLMIMAFWNRQLTNQRLLSVVFDALIAFLIFYLSILAGVSLGWAGLLPLFPAALYFNERAAVWVAVLSALVLGGLFLLFTDLVTALIFMAAFGGLYLVVGITVSVLSRRMTAVMQQTQRERAQRRQEARRIDRERRSVMYDLISELSATLNYQRVLDTALNLSATALANPDGPEEPMVSAVLLFSNDEASEARLRVGSARRFTSADMRITLSAEKGMLAETINEAEPRLIKDISNDPELERFIGLRDCRSAFCLPLRTGLEAYGVMLFAHPEVDFFTPERRELLQIIANQARIAIQNARLYRDLELEKERMTGIQEDARKKLARDLHDGPTQTVAALAMRVNFARRLMDRDAPAAAEELYKIEDLARRTTKEIRHMLFTLRPLVLESQGLTAALESMAEKMDETYGQSVIIETDEELIAQMEVSKQGVVFYIAEEAVNNARKHAQAEHIWVRIQEMEADLALLEIEDDGVGFDPASIEASYEDRGSLGMVNMRERTQLVNGVLKIDSADGHGTRVRVVIPLTEGANDKLRRRL